MIRAAANVAAVCAPCRSPKQTRDSRRTSPTEKRLRANHRIGRLSPSGATARVLRHGGAAHRALLDVYWKMTRRSSCVLHTDRNGHGHADRYRGENSERFPAGAKLAPDRQLLPLPQLLGCAHCCPRRPAVATENLGRERLPKPNPSPGKRQPQSPRSKYARFRLVVRSLACQTPLRRCSPSSHRSGCE